MSNEKVDLITGDPKKGIRKLAGPIVLTMLLMMLNNIVDSAWVAGLGSQQLAAVGYVTPIFSILVGVGTGIGAGASSLVSSYLGKKDKDNANSAAMHSYGLSIIVSIVFMIISLLFMDPILRILGASAVIDYAKEFSFMLFIWSFALIMPSIIGGVFRAEGDVKRATLPLIITAVINIILDPILIYVLNMGVAGAGLCTGLSGFIGLLVLLYWMFVKKDTYLDYTKTDFKLDLNMYKNILVVGIPACLEEVIFSLLVIIINFILTGMDGTTAVAAFTAGWRIVVLALMPATGIGTATTTIVGSALGARSIEKIKTAGNYAVKLGVTVSLICAIFVFIFSNQIAYLFSYSAASADVAPMMSQFLRIASLFIVAVPIGVSTGYVLQGLRKGTISLAVTIFRELVCVSLGVIICAYTLNIGPLGVYIGLDVGGLVGAIFSFSYLQIYLRRLESGKTKLVEV